MLECGVVCHTKCSHLVPDFCGMSMEKANLMLSEMKAANNRRRTFHTDSLQNFALDNHQNPLFTSTSSITTTVKQQKRPQSAFLSPDHISPQPSFSTPVSPKINSSASRPLSMVHDPSSFHSLTHLFSQNSISDTLAKAGSQIVSFSIITFFFGCIW